MKIKKETWKKILRVGLPAIGVALSKWLKPKPAEEKKDEQQKPRPIERRK